MRRTYAVMLLPLFLGGCMMLGMGGMGSGGGMHGSTPASAMGRTIVKESVVSGTRITAEFPAYAIGDALVYSVTLRDARDASSAIDASIALRVTPTGSVNAVANSEHGESTVRPGQGNGATMRVTPEAIGNGTYVFRPTITAAGSYRFLFVVDRVRGATIDPPIDLEQTVQLGGPLGEHSGNGIGLAPAALIGAGVMAVAMLFMFR